MSKLLYIEASPRKERSTSIAVAQEFLAAYRAANPEDEIDTWDLWAEPLPEFDGDAINAKYAIMHGQDHTPAQVSAWQSIVACCERFTSADKFLLSVPMWNFGVPYKLKHFVDVIAQPGQTFTVSPETGHTGLVTGKPAAVVYARGGEYSSNEQMQALDMQKPYLDLVLGFFGITSVSNLVVEPTVGSPDDVAKIKAAATSEAQSLAASF